MRSPSVETQNQQPLIRMEMTIPANGLVTARRARQSRLSILLSRHAHAILAVFPLLVLIAVVARYAVDVPYLDQWDFIPLLDKMYRGVLSFHDVSVQFNEHRLFFSNVTMLGLARLTGWNIRCECALVVVLAIGICLILMSQIRLTARLLRLPQLRWAIPVCSLVVFSISQYENWLWGWQVGLLLGLLTALGSILLLANQPFRWGKLIGAALLGFVATFSFGNGALVWPIGLALLCLLPPAGRVRKLAVCIWTLVAALSFWLYLRDYHNDHGHALVTVLFHRPFAYAAWVLKFIGGTCAQYGEGGILRDRTWALIFGLGALAVLLWAAWNIAQRMRPNLPALAPYFALCVYSLGTGLIAASARVNSFGPGLPACSRYCALTAPLWLSMIIFLMLLSQKDSPAATESRRVGRPLSQGEGLGEGEARVQCPQAPNPSTDRTRIARYLLWGIIAFLASSSVFGIRSAKEVSICRAKGRLFVLALKTDPSPESPHNELFTISESARNTVARTHILIQHHLSTFRD